MNQNIITPPRYTPSMLANVELPTYIDSTMLAAFRSCPRKFFNEYILNLRPELPSVHLHAGGAFAQALETFYTTFFLEHESETTAAAAGEAALINFWGDYIPREKEIKTLDRMIDAYRSYISYYPPASDHVQPYYLEGKPTVEFSFAIPLDDPYIPVHPDTGQPLLYVGRNDMLGRFNNLPVVKDDKTTSRLMSNWAESWNLHPQFMGYVWAARKSGIPCDTVCVRGTVIRTRDIEHVESFPKYSDTLLNNWYKLLARDVTQLVLMWETFQQTKDLDVFLRNFSHSCTAYSGCPFLTSCAQQEPNKWLTDFVVKKWNPLEVNPDQRIEPLGLAAMKKEEAITA